MAPNNKRGGLGELISRVGWINEGDVFFLGSFSRKNGFLGRLIHDSEMKTVRGYIRADENGKVLYNAMETPTVASRFLGRIGLKSLLRGWQDRSENFVYEEAFRWKDAQFTSLKGNLVDFSIDYRENQLVDLDARKITKFLLVGDYANRGTISIVPPYVFRSFN